MIKTLICATAACVLVGFAAPAQAVPADHGLRAAAPAIVHDVVYRGHRHYRPHHRHRHWHCWNVRVRHHWVRRCGWRTW